LDVEVIVHWRRDRREALGIAIETILGEGRSIRVDDLIPENRVDIELAYFCSEIEVNEIGGKFRKLDEHGSATLDL